ncbi:acyltransferase family protein [Arthrobacter sp. UM1]|uniref:acyltransferase family protein n=1 Tax=Arthrobacter sp. UM1 TaxID=2766776 RepID=UPI001CF6068B|nr:acyltransferase family protein [Arthrobacter sp. UM1]MCB4207997.1 acyltransferase family protein [Arthrobacter sp. UM1]
MTARRALPHQPAARRADVDAVRVFGILAVVAGHTWAYEWSRLAFYPWHVPLFFFASGYFWSPQRRTVRAEALVRAKTVLLPYLTFLAVLAPVYLLIAVPHTLSAEAGTAVRLLLGGRRLTLPFSAFWFVTALIVAAVLYRLMERIPFWWRGALFALLAASGALLGSVYAATPWSAGIGAASLVFMWFGELARRIEPNVRRPLPVGLALLSVGAAVTLLVRRPLDLKAGDFGVPLLGVATACAICLGLFLAARPLDSVLPLRVRRWVNSLALTGLGVVLGHAIVLWAMRPLLPEPLLFAVSAGLCWALALGAHRTRLSPWLLGVPQRETDPARGSGARSGKPRPRRARASHPAQSTTA